MTWYWKNGVGWGGFSKWKFICFGAQGFPSYKFIALHWSEFHSLDPLWVWQYGFVIPYNRRSDSTMAEFPTTMAVPFNAKLQHCASETLCEFNTASWTLCKLNTLCKKIHNSSVIDAPLCLSCPIIQCIYCTALDHIVTHVQHFITVYCGVCLGLIFGPTCSTIYNAQCNCSSSTLCNASSTLCALCIVVFRRA